MSKIKYKNIARNASNLRTDPLLRIERQFQDLESLLQITLTVHDRAGLFTTTDGQSLLNPARRSHRHPICQIGRFRRPGWDAHCLSHCLQSTNTMMRKKKCVLIQSCWKGVMEAAVPLMGDGVHIATIFVGAFRSPKGPGKKYRAEFSGKFWTHYDELPSMGEKRLNQVGEIVRVFGQGLLTEVEDIRKLDSGTGDRKTEILRFIHYHAHRVVTLKELAGVLYLSPSRTSHLVRELFDKSFKDLLIDERIRRAKSLLVGSSLTAGTIAKRIGLDNEYYFNRLFKQRVGIPPGAFRKSKQTESFQTREG